MSVCVYVFVFVCGHFFVLFLLLNADDASSAPIIEQLFQYAMLPYALVRRAAQVGGAKGIEDGRKFSLIWRGVFFAERVEIRFAALLWRHQPAL